MRKAFLGVAVLSVLVPLSAMAQNPHFTTCETTIVNGQASVSGQIAGLGNQSVPRPMTVTATAVCVDATVDPPVIQGSVPVVDSGVVPGKRGNIKFTIPIDVPFVLPCTPPAVVVMAGVEVCDFFSEECTETCPLVEG